MPPTVPARSVMFAYVQRMNEAFGNERGNPDAYEPDAESRTGWNETAWARLQRQCENIGGALENGDGSIAGEVFELLIAIEKRDVLATRDALCDIMVFALGAYHFLGYDADADMIAVLDAVMTRFCRTPEEMQATVEHWAKQGITDVYTQGLYPQLCIKTRTSQVANNGERFPAGKFLKSVGFKQPVFPPAHAAPVLPTAETPRSFIGAGRVKRSPDSGFGALDMAEATAPQRRKEDQEPKQ